MRNDDPVYMGLVSETICGILDTCANSKTLIRKFYRHQTGWLAAIGAYYLFLMLMVIGEMPRHCDSGLTLAILIVLAASFAVVGVLVSLEVYRIHKHRN